MWVLLELWGDQAWGLVMGLAQIQHIHRNAWDSERGGGRRQELRMPRSSTAPLYRAPRTSCPAAWQTRVVSVVPLSSFVREPLVTLFARGRENVLLKEL